MAKTKKLTPAQRARLRKDAAVMTVPQPPKGDRFSSVKTLTINSVGVDYPIGPNVDGQTPWSMGMDQTGQISIPVRSDDDSILRALGNEANLLEEGVRVTVDGVVYVVSGVDYDGQGLYTLTVEDEVSWKMRLYTSFMSASRATITRFGFIQRMVDEAGRAPLEPIESFIPEIDDPQPIKKTRATAS